MLPRRGSSGQWRSLVAENQQNSTNDNQVNFSGDSQDSRGGYTRLSVREPLSNVRNQAAPRRNVDPHYATVSDDSEEMYAAIENGDGKYNVYQKIQRKGGTGTAHDQADESEDEDEDEEDQFYEKVKSKAPSTHPVPSQLPAHSNPSVLKHGYEKIKPKCPITDTGNSDLLSTPQGIAGACGLKLVKVGTSSLESDEDGSLYERVKYSPYERVKESQDHFEKVEDFYEDINYSRVSKPNERTPNLNETASRSDKSESVSDWCGAGGEWASATIILVPPPDIQNLYARVDVTKKKRNTIISIVP